MEILENPMGIFINSYGNFHKKTIPESFDPSSKFLGGI